MTTLNIPQARIQIGWANVGGQRVPVEIDPEWMRYFSTLTERAGGTTGTSTTELVESAFDDAGIEDAKAAVYRNYDDLNQLPIIQQLIEQATDQATQINDLQALVAEVVKSIQDIRQGQP